MTLCISNRVKNNIVVENGAALLVDYGLNSCVEQVPSTGILDYFKAPELANPQISQLGKPTKEADVYAFGITCFEVSSSSDRFWYGILNTLNISSLQILSDGYLPYGEITEAELRTRVLSGVRPDWSQVQFDGTLSQSAAMQVRLEIEKCWHTDCSMRSKISDVKENVEREKRKATTTQTEAIEWDGFSDTLNLQTHDFWILI